MSQIIQCDRCHAIMAFDNVNPNTKFEDGWYAIGAKARYEAGELNWKVYGIDLCKTCMKDFREFVSGAR